MANIRNVQDFLIQEAAVETIDVNKLKVQLIKLEGQRNKKIAAGQRVKDTIKQNVSKLKGIESDIEALDIERARLQAKISEIEC